MNKRQLLKSTVWNVIGMSFSSIISLVLLIIITRLNGIDESGTFSFLFSLCLIIYTITLYGGRIYQVSDYKDEYPYNTYYSLKIVTSIVSIAILLFYLIICRYSNNEIMIAILLLIVKIIDAFSDAIYGVFQKNDRLDLVGKSLTIKTVLSVTMLIVVDYFTNSLMFAMFAYAVTNFIVFIFYDKLYEKRFVKNKIQIDKQIIKLLSSTKFIFLNNFVSNILLNVPRFVVKSVYSSAELGYFGILIMIPTVLSLFGQFIVQPILIGLTESFNKGKKRNFERYIYKCFECIFLISIICILAAYFLGPQVLTLLYGIDFDYYRLSLIFLIIGGTFNVLSYILSTALNVFRKTMIQTVIYIFTFVTSTLVFYLFAINYSIKIIFIVYLFIMLLQFVLLYIYYLIVKKNIFLEVK